MKVRVLSLGRKIAIGACSALAVVTGTLSVAYPHITGGKTAQAADIFTSIDVESSSISFSYLEKGLDKLTTNQQSSVFAQIKEHTTLMGIPEGGGAAEKITDFDVTGIAYTEGKTDEYIVTYQVGSLAPTLTIKAGEPVFGSVSVSVNEKYATLVDGVWKINGNDLKETLFLADQTVRPTSDLLTFLNVAYQYENISVPVAKTDANNGLAQVSEYSIMQESFSAGTQTVGVSVKEQDSDYKTGELSVIFEEVKYVALEATQNKITGGWNTLTDIASNITVTGIYNYAIGGASVENRQLAQKDKLDTSEFTVEGSLLPNHSDFSDTITNYTPVDSVSSGKNTDRPSNVPATITPNTYHKTGNSIRIVSASDRNVAAQQFEIRDITLYNPNNIIGIAGKLPQQTVGKKLDLTGMTVSLNYLPNAQDISGNVGLSETIYGLNEGAPAVVVANLSDFTDCLEVSYNGAEYISYSSEYLLRETDKNVKLKYYYGGKFGTGASARGATMFFRCVGLSGVGVNIQTKWGCNSSIYEYPNAQNITFSNGGSSTEETIRYFSKPVLNQSMETYRTGLKKEFINFDPNDEHQLIAGTAVTITKAAQDSAQEQSVVYTYQSSNGRLVAFTENPAFATQMGIEYTTAGVFNISATGEYSVKVTLPTDVTDTDKANNIAHYYWFGTETNEATYRFTVIKGDANVAFFGATTTVNGLTVQRGDLLNTLLNRLEVKFTANGTIINDRTAPDTYRVYLRLIDKNSGVAGLDQKILVQEFVGGAKTDLANDNRDTIYKHTLSEEQGAKYALHVESEANDYFSAKNTYQNYITLSVDPVSVLQLQDQFEDFDPNRIVSQYTNSWKDAIKDGDSYTVTIQKEDGTAVNSGDPLHAGTYKLIFTTNVQGLSSKEVKLTVNAVQYANLTDAIKNEAEYGAIDKTAIETALTAAATAAFKAEKAKNNVYYTFNADNATVTFKPVGSGSEYTNIETLPAGEWVAVFKTAYGTNGQAGDYNLPEIQISFTVSKATVSLTAGGDFTLNNNTYEATYNYSGLNFILNGWATKYKDDLGITFSGKNFFENTSVTGDVTEADDSYTIKLYVAGMYTVSVRKLTENIQFAENMLTEYSLKIKRAKATLETTKITVSTGAFSLPNDQITIKGVNNQFANVEGLKVGKWRLFDRKNNEVKEVEYAPDKTYTLEIESINGELVRMDPSQAGSNRLPYGYDVCYEAPTNWTITVNVAKKTIPVLTPDMSVTGNPLTPVQGEENTYTLPAIYGNTIDLRAYFSNTAENSAYVITRTPRTPSANSMAKSAREGEGITRGLVLNNVPAGEWALTISTASGFICPETVTIYLTVAKQQIEKPSVDVVTKTYNGADQTITLGTAAYFANVSVTAYRFATNVENFTEEADNMLAESKFVNGVLTLHDAGNYWVVFALKDSANYEWIEGEQVIGTAELGAVRVAIVNRLAVQAPELGSARVWSESDTNIVFNPTNKTVSVTENGNTFTVNFAVGTTDTTNKQFVITMTGDNVENFVWVQNTSDTQGMQYLTSYGDLTGFDATTNASVAKLNYAIAETLNLNYTNKAVSLYYGGYYTEGDNANTLFDNGLETDDAAFDSLFGYSDNRIESNKGVTVTKSYYYLASDNTRTAFTGEILKGLSVGTYSILIDLTFSGNFTPMSFVIQLTIEARPVTLTLTGATSVYGEEAFSNTTENPFTIAYAANSLQFDEIEGTDLNNNADIRGALKAGAIANLSVNNYKYSAQAWVVFNGGTSFVNYNVSFDGDSTLSITKAETQVNVVIDYIHGEAVADKTGTITPSTANAHVKVTFGAGELATEGLFKYTIDATDATITLSELEGLTNANYTFVQGICSLNELAANVTVTIQNVGAPYGIPFDLTEITDSIIKVEGTSDALLGTGKVAVSVDDIKNYITLNTTAFIEGGTDKVGKYAITGEANENAKGLFNFTFAEGVYSVDFDLATMLKLTGEKGLAYNGAMQNLISSATIADGVEVGIYSIYYSVVPEGQTLPQNPVWSTAAQALNAGKYHVHYYIDIEGYGKVYSTAIGGEENQYITVEVAKGKNELTTGFNFANENVSSENTPEKDAFTYGGFDANGEQRITVPVSDFGGAITYSLMQKVGEAYNIVSETAESSDVNALFATYANKLPVGTYYLKVVTSGTNNYNGATVYYCFTVGKAELTIKADNQTIDYGDQLTEDKLTSTPIGLKNGETLETALGDSYTVKLSFADSYTNGANAGDYENAILVKLYNGENEVSAIDLANYTLTLTNGNIRVEKRLLTVFIPSHRVSFGANEKEIEDIKNGLSATLIGGNIYQNQTDKILTINDLIELAIDVDITYADGSLSTATGKYAIFATWKDNNGANYELSFSGCDWDGSNITTANAIGNGARGTAGTFTIEKMIVNATWTKENAYVYTGDKISIDAKATSYVDSNGNTQSLATPKDLVLSYQQGKFVDNKFTPTGDKIANDTPTNAGVYKIFAEPSDTNYTTAGAFIVITIDKATATLTVGNATMSYGNELPTDITLTAEGILEKDSEVKTSLEKTEGKNFVAQDNGVTIDNINQKNVGTYTLTLDEVETDNYTIVVRSGALTITQREITVTLDALSQNYTGAIWNQTALSDVTIATDKVDNIPTFLKQGENGATVEQVALSTFGITLSSTDTIQNAGTYKVTATASNTGNYNVKFAGAAEGSLNRTTTDFTVNKVGVTISEEVHVVFGETTAKEVIYTINSAVNGETYQSLWDSTQNVTAAGGHTLYVVNNRAYTLTRTGITYTVTPNEEISFLNYNVTGYTTTCVVEQREITASTQTVYEYRGEFTPEFTFTGLVSDYADVTANWNVAITKDGAPVTQIEDVGVYVVTLSFKEENDYGKAYKFAQSEFTVTVTPKVIELRWEKDSIPEFNPNASAADRINTIVPVNPADKDTIWSLIQDKKITFVFEREYTPYTINPDGTYIKGDKDTVPINQHIEDMAKGGVGIMVEAIGAYTAKLTLSADKAQNYSFKDGVMSLDVSFNVFTHTVTMDILIDEKGYEYNGKPVNITIKTDDSNIDEQGTVVTRTDTFASITKEQADALSALSKITSADVEELSFRGYTATNAEGQTVQSAPSAAGYYVIHVSYLNETPKDGTLGADGYAVFRITPKYVTTVPEWDVKRGEDGQLPTFEYTVKDGKAQGQEFVYVITDASMIAAFQDKAIKVTATGRTLGNSQELSANRIHVDGQIRETYTFNGKELTNVLVYVITATDAGNYSVTFELTSENYQWEPYESGGMGGEISGIPTNDDGNYELGFSIGKGSLDFEVEGATGEGDVKDTITLTFGQNYREAIEKKLTYTPDETDAKRSVHIEFFTNEDGNHVEYPDIPRAGTYYAYIIVEATDNTVGVEKRLTLIVEQRIVSVRANISTVFGSKPVFNSVSQFEFDGFVGGDNAESVLTIDYAKLNAELTLDATVNPSKFNGDLINMGNYRGILTLPNGVFGARGEEDNYIYEFDRENSVVTVTPLAITVQVGNASTPYGAPVLSALRNTSLITENTLPETAIGGLAELLNVSLSGVSQETPAGSYRIVTEADNPNYSVTFEGGVYTVTPVAVNIVISAGGGIYGGTIERAHIQNVTSSEYTGTLSAEQFEKDVVFYYEGTTYAGDAYARTTRLPSLAGSYTVTAEINPNAPGNFSLAGSVSRVFTIDKMTISTDKLSIADKSYTGNSFAPTVTIDEEFAAVYADRFTIEEDKRYTNAGTYPVTLTVNDAANVQFTGGSNTYQISFIINKANNGVSKVEIEGWTYGDTPNAPQATLEKSEGYDNAPVITYEYRDTSNANSEWTTNVPTLAGTNYLVRAVVAASTNYNACVSGGYEFTIAKRVLTVPTLNIIKEGEGKNDTYTGSTLLASVNDYDAATMTLSYGDSFSIEGNQVTLSALTVGGYKVHVSLLDADNYAWDESDLVIDGVVELVWDVSPMRIQAVPTANTDKFTVDGTILTYVPFGFDERYMKLGGDYQTGHSGTFKVKVDLIDNVNYTWADGSIGTITFEWEVGGVHNVFIGIVSGLSGVAVIAGVAILAQVLVHKKKMKQAEAEREARSNESSDAGNGAGEEV